MAFHAIPLCAKLEIIGQADGQQVVNILHYKYTAPAPTAASLLTWIAAWRTAHETQWLACHSSGYTLLAYIATDIATVAGATATVNVAATVGTIASALQPNNVALAISWRTGASGRTNRGRTYMGGLPLNGVVNDAVVGSLVTALTNLAGALISQTFTGGFDFAVGSFKDSLAKIITGFILETITDSMRRRLPTRGN